MVHTLIRSLTSKQFIKGALAVLIGVACYIFAPADLPEPGRRILFVFVTAALFWALEIVPLYATSIFVVLLQIFLLCRPGGVLNMDAGGYKVFMLPFGSPIIILFFGGFMLAAALKKFEMDRFIATHLLKLFGQKPYFLMLGFMCATAFLSMWMSNTATTAMMIAMVIPLLQQMDAKDPFRKALILSIPFAANIGGMGTPVGTPPNAIAIGLLSNSGTHINFLTWVIMAFPLVMILLFLASFLLIFMFPPRSRELSLAVRMDRKIDHQTWEVILISLFTIALWLTSTFHKIPAAVVALLAACLFVMRGLLDRDDIKNVDWDVLVLMWGGLALGKGMEISGFTDWLIALPIFNASGVILVVIFCVLAVVLSTFMSNTATANLVIPIVLALPGENQLFLAITIALSCSLAMALPVSTPPNAIAFATNMIKGRDMLIAGGLISIVSTALILLGYQWILPMTFGGG